MYDLKSKKT